MIIIDGSEGSAGGQMLRTSLAMSAITGKPFRMVNIRSGRPNPGLKPSHLSCLEVFSKLSDCSYSDVEPGSTSITFRPGSVNSRRVDHDIGTAGSVTLVLQSLMPFLLSVRKRFKVSLVGGTDVSWSPSWDYTSNVLVPHLRRYAEIESRLLRRGFYPKGGGRVEVTILPRKMTRPLILRKGLRLLGVRGASHASKSLIQKDVAARQAVAAENALKALDVPVIIDRSYSETSSTGSVITLWALFGKGELDVSNPTIIGASQLGEKGRKAEEVGSSAAAQLASLLGPGSCVDPNLSDQLMPYLAMYGGFVEADELTEHTSTNIGVIEKFAGKVFELDGARISVGEGMLTSRYSRD